MRYVLDSNVALKWVLNEPGSAEAIQIRDERQQGMHEFIAPDIFPVEVAHAIARAERRGAVPPGDGSRRLVDVLRYMPVLHTYLPLLARAFDLASQYRIGVYDCLYVVLAEDEACELLTADDRLIRVLQPTYPFITSLATAP